MPDETTIYRRSVFFCVLPHELYRHVDELQQMYDGGEDDVRFIVERRGGDRRVTSEGAPDGAERRAGQRREAAVSMSALDAGIELPRALAKHAMRLRVVVRSVPVHFQDANREADELLAAAPRSAAAREELRLRYQPAVRADLRRRGVRRHSCEVSDAIFDDLFADPQDTAFRTAMTRATNRVLKRR